MTETDETTRGRRALAVALAAALSLAGLLDAVSTELALATGQAIEANPLVRAIQGEVGSFWLLPKLLVHILLAYVILTFPTRLTFAVMGALTATTFLVALSNFDIYFDIVMRGAV